MCAAARDPAAGGAPGRRVGRVRVLRAEVCHLRAGDAAGRRPVHPALRRVRPRVRRPRRRGHRGRGHLAAGGHRLRRTAGARAEGGAGPADSPGLPDRPQAVRGPGAALPAAGQAGGDPRADLRLPGLHGVLRRPADPRRARRRHGDADRQRAGRRLSRPRPLRRQGRARSPLREQPGRADLHPARPARALPVAVGGALLGRRRQRERGLLPVRRPATAVHPGRARVQGGQLHRRSRLHRGHPRGRRPAQGPVPEREGRRHRQAGTLQRRDDGRLPRQPAGDLPGLRLDPRPVAAGLPARRQADRHAGRAEPEPLLVHRRGHAGGGPPVALLRDVHLDRDRHRHRLRHLLPLPLRRGAVPGPQPQGSHRDHRGPHRPRDAAERRHRRGDVLRADASRISGACRSSASSPAAPSCWPGWR